LVGFSGGLDSTVLLHLLAHTPAMHALGVRAIHVHHGLHPEADRWALHCQNVCAALDVPLLVTRVHVDRTSGLGLEGAARTARHAAFIQALGEDEILVLAHHRDDQAETFLLRALRGAGVDGLGAMRAWRRHAQGWLWRPLLDQPRQHLLDYARHHTLNWLQDPANADEQFDRNFLRRQVLPLLQRRWPHAAELLARSAGLCAQASDLLTDEDAVTLASLQLAPDTLDGERLRALPAPRRARVLRQWIAHLGLPPLPAQGIARIEAELLPARPDTHARFDWHGARIQRWRHLLHAGWQRQPLPADWQQCWDGRTALTLPNGDQLRLIGADAFDSPLLVRPRRGGERILLPGRQHSHTLKHVLQSAGIPPWQRQRLPLLCAGTTVLAAGDRILSAGLAAWLDTHDAHLQWTPLT
jgi:tRNA(Ile)-lysidine synthase